MIRSLIAACLIAFPSTVLAGFNSDITFTAPEIASHTRHIETITKNARAELERIWADHLAFYQANGFSKYYGDRNKLLDTPAKRQNELRRIGKPPGFEPQLVPISCIGLTLKALEKGFRNADDPDLVKAWGKLEAFTRANDLDGTALIHALQQLGWKVYYWNPDPSKVKLWDEEEKGWESKGWHAERYRTVTQRRLYYLNKVDDASLLVGFGNTVPAAFVKFPLFVGVAHTGYHVFPGFYGKVIEAHSVRKLSSVDNLEASEFNPFAPGGGPRWTPNEKYRSGLVAVPPPPSAGQ